ncbi:MAG: hypothetical protein ACK40G_16455 [Cytophagaceae bacterium]
MGQTKHLLNLDTTKSILLFFVKALLLFFVLKFIYSGYNASVTPTSKYFISESFAKYSLIEILRKGLVVPASFIISLFGFDVTNNGYSVFISGYQVLKVNNSCLGIEIIFAYVSLIIAYPSYPSRIKNIIIGIGIIYLLNILRMVVVGICFYKSVSMGRLNHDVFNVLSYAFIIIYFYIRLKYISSDDYNSHQQMLTKDA